MKRRQLLLMGVGFFSIFLSELKFSSDLDEKSDTRSFALTGGRLVDGAGNAPIENSLVIVAAGRIVYAGAKGDSQLQAGVREIDCRGKTVLPGLMDAHIHLGGSSAPLYQYLEDRRKLAGFLYCGVTSVLDLAGVPEAMFDLRAQMKKEPLRSPAFFTVGPCFTSPGGHGTEYGVPMAVTPKTEAEARSEVERLALQRPDFIKIIYGKGDKGFTSLSYDLMAAIVDASHKFGLKVVTHITGVEQARDAVKAGSDGLAHVAADAEMDEALLRQMKQGGVFCIPTLSVYEALDQLAYGGDLKKCLLDSPLSAKGICREIHRELQVSQPDAGAPGPIRKRLAMAQRNVKRMRESGIKLVLGTDAGNPWVLFGPSVHRELELLVAAGLTPLDAIVSATKNAAAVLGIGAESGTIEKGKWADLVVVNGNPLKDIAATRDIALVINKGWVVDRNQLEGIINGAAEPEKAPDTSAKKEMVHYPPHRLDGASVDKLTRAIGLLKTGNDTWELKPMQEAKNLILMILASGHEENVYPLYYLGLCNYRLITLFFSRQQTADAEKCLIEAKECLGKAMRVSTKFAELEALYATLLGYEIALHPEKAPQLGIQSIQYMSGALNREPENPRINLLQGSSLLYTPENYGGGVQKALPFLRKSVEFFSLIPPAESLEPDWGYVEALTILGMAHKVLKDFPKAKECFQHALQINPGYGLAVSELRLLENEAEK